MDNRFVVLSLLEDLQHWPIAARDDFSTEQPLQDDGGGSGRDENLLSAGSASDHNEEPKSRQRARCHAVRHLVALGRKMGPRWTASEVVPYLLRSLDEEDGELALAVGEVITALVALIAVAPAAAASLGDAAASASSMVAAATASSCVPLEAALPVLEALAVCADEGVRRALAVTFLPTIFFGCPFPAFLPSADEAAGVVTHADATDRDERSKPRQQHLSGEGCGNNGTGMPDSHAQLVELAVQQAKLTAVRGLLQCAAAVPTASPATPVSTTGPAAASSVRQRLMLTLLDALLAAPWPHAQACAATFMAHLIQCLGLQQQPPQEHAQQQQHSGRPEAAVLTRPLLPRTPREAEVLRHALLMAQVSAVASLPTTHPQLDLRVQLTTLLFDRGLLATGPATGGARMTRRVQLVLDADVRRRPVVAAMVEAVPLLVAGGALSLHDALLSLQDVSHSSGSGSSRSAAFASSSSTSPPSDELHALYPFSEDHSLVELLLRAVSQLLRTAPNDDLADVLHPFTTNGLPSLLRPLTASPSWKVRFVATHRIATDLLRTLFRLVSDPSLGHTRLLPALLATLTTPPVLEQLFGDCEEEVRTAVALVTGELVAHAAAAVARTRPTSSSSTNPPLLALLAEQQLALLEGAVGDESDRVRAAAATSLAAIAVALVVDTTTGAQEPPPPSTTATGVERATRMLLGLLRDDQMLVQLAVIGELRQVLSHSGSAANRVVQTELVQVCHGLAGNANWRVRASYATVLVAMCRHFLVGEEYSHPTQQQQHAHRHHHHHHSHAAAAAFAAAELLPLLVDVLFDKAHAVRHGAAAHACGMCRRSDYVRELLWHAAKASPRAWATYQGRMSLLQLAIRLQLDHATSLRPLFDQFGRDSVPNVRMAVAKALTALLTGDGGVVAVGPDEKQQQQQQPTKRVAMTGDEKTAMLPLLRLLVEDGSADVRECAASALEKCF